MYSQEPCIVNDISYNNVGNLNYCDDGTTGCDCTDECGGNAQMDDCDNCVGGSTGLSINHFEDECGVCDIGTTGPGPQITCWDNTIECNENLCPFNPNNCPSGTEGREEYLNYTDICVPLDFSTVNQSTVRAFYSFESVVINGVSMDDGNWVGAFNDSLCVGVQLWDVSQCSLEFCGLAITVMGDDGSSDTEGYCSISDAVTFQIWDASMNIYYDAVASEDIPWGGNNISTSVQSLNVNTDLLIEGLSTPYTYNISNVYPNPFNPITSIEYSLSENSTIELLIYNIHGRQIQTLVQGFQTAGYHSINWNASNYPSGVYLIQLASAKHIENRKIIFIK